VGEFAEQGERVGFVVGGFDHHEDRHGDQDGLEQVGDAEVRDVRQGAENLIGNQPGDEEVEALKGMEADVTILTETVGG